MQGLILDFFKLVLDSLKSRMWLRTLNLGLDSFKIIGLCNVIYSCSWDWKSLGWFDCFLWLALFGATNMQVLLDEFTYVDQATN